MINKIFGTIKALLQMPGKFTSEAELIPDKINYLINHLPSLDDIEIIKIQNGKICSQINKNNKTEILENIHLAEFKVFSQWGDDGIIQFLIEYLGVTQHTFIEFGVENYKEANTRFLLMNNNWRGLIMDGSDNNISQIKSEHLYWKYSITALSVFITKENINAVISKNGFTGEIGLLHIDIDGNDYWIWQAIDIVSPVIVIVEYNSIFGNEKSWTINYKPDFFRSSAHYTNLYYGCSLTALCDLADEKGYYFIGCNSSGNNAYFIRKDKIRELKPLTAIEGFVTSKFRESRDEKGNLTFLTGQDSYNAIKGNEIYNTRTGNTDTI